MYKENVKICIIGLGYVGLPLAVEFSKKFKTAGYDINEKRVNDLNSFLDITNEIDNKSLQDAVSKNGLFLTTNSNEIKNFNFYIITVPTPVDSSNNPNLKPLISATTLVGSLLKKDDYVVFESTVYPGCTEEKCIPILEEKSGFKLNEDFYCGYSPERINPGDKKHTLTKIKKITSGSNLKSAKTIDNVYSEIISAGTFSAKSIKVAEAAKVIENAQRDINIAFVNELSKIFNKMDIDTLSVIEAASTKWNFLPFKPGLVGGHCIGVDPYYLADKAKQLGYHPEIILSGRRVNDSMGNHIANQFVKELAKREIALKNQKILILGITFKEDCPDIRNSKVIDIIDELKNYNLDIEVLDPLANIEEVKNEFSIDICNSINQLKCSSYDGILIAVAHGLFKKIDYKKLYNDKTLVYDVKGILNNFNKNILRL